jgi:quercetin dioxygenase-like cupin family protein
LLQKNHKQEIEMRLFLLFICFMLTATPSAKFSQSSSPQLPVEISGEPHHHPKFENEFVRVWDVAVPAGEATLWHAHREDNVVVALGDASLRIETAGATPSEGVWKFAEVRFGKATYVHRAINIGTSLFQNVTVELLKSPAFRADLSNLPKEAGRDPILENDRVRVYRLSLAPGEVIAMHTHPLPGLVVTITAGEIEVTTEGQRTTHKVNNADVSWRAGAVTHSIRNIGKTRFEALDIELK